VLQPAAARLVEPLGPPAAVHIRCNGSTLHLRSRLVVGADGIRSSVARHAGLAAPGTCGRKFGFAFDIPACAGAGAIPPESIEMFVVAGGYLGVVRRGGDGLHVAGLIGGRKTRGSNPHAFVESVAGRFGILAEAGLDRLPRLDRTRTLGAGPMPCRPRRVVGGPVALVGDAAGYVEPFTGEGMSWALGGAEILARAVAGAAPGSWTPAAARRYARGWADRIGRRQRACTALGRALDRPAVSRALLAVAARRPALVNRLVRRAVLS
jgi:flavin-dependent dehydrogenase